MHSSSVFGKCLTVNIVDGIHVKEEERQKRGERGTVTI